MHIAALVSADTITTSQWAIKYGFVVLGIVMSIVLPLLRHLLPQSSSTKAVLPPWWERVKPYLVVGAFSISVALLVLAFGGEAAAKWSWQTAVLSGYAWDSTLQKIAKA